MIHRFIDPFRPRSMPLMTRQSYVHEMVTSLTMPVGIALMESGVVGILAKKIFDVGDFQLAAITAAPVFGNLTSFFWARLARGRRKVRSITLLQLLMLGSVSLISLLPRTEAGPWLLTSLVILSRCLASGVITLRSAVWRMNYPRPQRARITGRLAMIASLTMMTVPVASGFLLDRNESSFRFVYPCGALVASIGVVAFSKVRLRGERALLEFERRGDSSPTAHGEAGSIYEYDPRDPRPSVWTVLRGDPVFRRYMIWQFIGGFANIMAEPILIQMVAANPRAGFASSMLILTFARSVTALISLPRWSAYLDSVHITRFRVAQISFWSVAHVILWIGAISDAHEYFLLSLVLIAVARLTMGIGGGGGMLAWTLGHNDFASRELVALYMGIHVTLTGVRGVVAPFLAVVLYAGWNGFAIPGLGLSAPGFGGTGEHIFLLAAALNIIAIAGFYAMSRSLPASR